MGRAVSQLRQGPATSIALFTLLAATASLAAVVKALTVEEAAETAVPETLTHSPQVVPPLLAVPEVLEDIQATEGPEALAARTLTAARMAAQPVAAAAAAFPYSGKEQAGLVGPGRGALTAPPAQGAAAGVVREDTLIFGAAHPEIRHIAELKPEIGVAVALRGPGAL
jgi:hypothetical protein